MSHAYYLWTSYLMSAAAIVAEIVVLFARRARARRAVEEERDLEAQD